MRSETTGELGTRPGKLSGLFTAMRARQGLLLGYAVALGAALSYSLTQVLTRQNIDKLGSPVVGVVFTVFFGTIVLALMNLRSIKLDMLAERRGMVYFAIAGIFANIGVTCLFFALKSSPIVVVSPILAINPLITLVLASLFLRRLEKITFRIYAGALLVVIGVIIIAVAQAR